MGCQSPFHPSLRAGLATSCGLCLDIFLFTQFVRMVFFFFHEVTEGKAREETWSSVNYLFFISTSLIYGENQKVKQGIM